MMDWEHWPPAMGDVIANRWKITANHATIGLVRRSFNVQNEETGIAACCILHTMVMDNIFVLDETGRGIEKSARIVKELTLRSLSSVPHFIEYHEEDASLYRYLCTTPVGQPLKELQARIRQIDVNNRFSSFTCLHLGFETLNGVKEFHDAGYLHRSLNPSAFCVMPSFSPGVVMFPAWFNRSRRWLDFDGVSTIPACTNPSLHGHFVYEDYASIRALRSEEEGRFDDLWSWFYTLVDLTCGLNWPQFVGGQNFHEWQVLLADAKEALHERPSEWLQSAPEEYTEILHYLKSSSSEDEPDYARLHQLLKKAMKRVAQNTNGEVTLDWEPGGQYHEVLRPLVYGPAADDHNNNGGP